jgi:hypothetical protein
MNNAAAAADDDDNNNNNLTALYGHERLNLQNVTMRYQGCCEAILKLLP